MMKRIFVRKMALQMTDTFYGDSNIFGLNGAIVLEHKYRYLSKEK